MMARQPIPDVGLTIMVKSVINDLAGTVGFVRVSLLFVCGSFETN